MSLVANLVVGLLLWAALGALFPGLSLLMGRGLSPRLMRTWVSAHSIILFATAFGLLAVFFQSHAAFHEIQLPDWLAIGDWAWRPVFLVDSLSATYVGLIVLVYVAIVRFSMAALIREPGANRYWFLVTLFAFGLLATALSGNLDVLYLGWELVGVTSVMLIAFFRNSVRSNFNSLRALIYYRLGDLFLLGAAVEIHHLFPQATFSQFGQQAATPAATWLAAALLVGTLAKSAQLPFSPWLHRAMEGPASSSGVFYGALSVHLGPFLLLRTSSLWEPHVGIRVAMATIGLTTALYATWVGRTRPDAKTALAYATMTQIGLLYVEIALGLQTLALVHLCAHASLRTWQFLRSSSLIQDFQDNPLFRQGVRLTRASAPERRLPLTVKRWLYLAALRQFWLDGLQWNFVAKPILAAFTFLLRLEERLLGPSVRKQTLFHGALTTIAWLWGFASHQTHGAHVGRVYEGFSVVAAIVHIGMGLATRNAFRAVISLAASQVWLILIGNFSHGVGPLASQMLLLAVVAGVGVMLSVLYEVRQRHGISLLASDNGIADLSPRLNVLMLTMGWLWVGLPGGITFFAEDVLFHSLLEDSMWVTGGFLVAATLGPVVFYRIYIGVFSGVPRPEVFSFEAQPVPEVVGVFSPFRLALTVGVLVMGIFPRWFFQ